MKRGGPLRRTTTLKRTPLARGEVRFKRSSMKRTATLKAKPLPPAEQRRRAEVRAAVFARDGGCLLRNVQDAGRCFGDPFTFHHRRKASQGGAYTVENGATLCAHHNTQLEADADMAAIGIRLGLVLTVVDV